MSGVLPSELGQLVSMSQIRFNNNLFSGKHISFLLK